MNSPSSTFYWLRSLLPPFPELGEPRAERFLKIDPQLKSFAYLPAIGVLANCEGSWDVRSGLRLGIDPLSHVGAIMPPIEISPCGRWVVFVGHVQSGGDITGGYVTGSVCVWDTKKGTVRYLSDCVWDGDGASPFPTELAVFPDGRRLACLRHNRSVSVWDLESGELIAHTTGVKIGTANISFSPNGRLVAVGGWWDDAIHIWDLEKSSLLFSLPGHLHGVRSVMFSIDSDQIVSVGLHTEGNGSRVWDCVTGCEVSLPAESVEVMSPVNGIVDSRWQVKLEYISYSARDFLGETCHREAKVICAATGSVCARFPIKLDTIGDIIVNHPSGRIWAGCYGRRVYVFSMETFGTH